MHKSSRHLIPIVFLLLRSEIFNKRLFSIVFKKIYNSIRNSLRIRINGLAHFAIVNDFSQAAYVRNKHWFFKMESHLRHT